MPSISSAAAIYSVRGGRASRDIRRSAAAELRAAPNHEHRETRGRSRAQRTRLYVSIGDDRERREAM
ncbi:MAG: hypothetical protein DMD91_00275 [Candidatus Rokuibacteriota bacterium]|nr:MAG: hypothetical protein DMD91_00275 [Candidatus Rokubacteria bacterium]